ncbi:MAG TPA: immunoglobulin domain-containing protein, partial [Candidatus Saccharimonadales bacterium]|nr:immunoglobulin domain-containing protein [Candidatus Saccharimonadales bacterium]
SVAHLSFQWSHNGTPIPNQTSSSLSLIGVQASDAGDYTVAISSGCSTVSSSATLRVMDGPVPEPNHVAIFQSGGNYKVRFVGTPGTTYLLKRSVDLVEWQTVLTVQAPADGFIEYPEPSTASGAVFYRMVAQ